MFKKSTKKGPEIGKEDFAYSKKGGKWHEKLKNKYVWYDQYHQHKWSTPINFAVLAVFSVSMAAVVIMSLQSRAAIPSTSFTLANSHRNYAYSYKANLHAHTNYGPLDDKTCNNDDGLDYPVEAADWYREHGFAFYALTSHIDLHYLRCHPDSADIPDTPSTDGERRQLFTSVVRSNTPYNQIFKRSTETAAKRFLCVMGYQESSTINHCTNKNYWIQGTLVPANPIAEKVSSLNPFIWAGVSAEINMYPSGAVVTENGVTKVSASSSDAKINGVHVGIINIPSTLLDTINGYKTPDFNLLLIDGLVGVQSAISNIKNGGGISVIHHPGNSNGFNVDSAVKVAGMTGTTGVEIRNGGYTNLTNKYDFDSFWDDRLFEGKKLWGFGGDDGHKSADRGKAFIVINSSTSVPNRTDLLNQVRAGNFIVSTPVESNYMTQAGGPVRDQANYYDLKITTTGHSITATTVRGSYIRFVVDKIRMAPSSGKSQTYTVSNTGTKYVRAEVWHTCTASEAVNNYNGECTLPVAYSQPIWVVPTP